MGTILSLTRGNGLTLSSGFLWGVFLLTGLVVAIIGATLIYHWRQYLYPPGLDRRVQAIFLLGLAISAAIAILAILSYSA